jgi:hypothetical protein
MNFNLPTVPYSAIDHANRRAAATGSIEYAMRASSANYNGHHITISFNAYRGYWIAEHFYGERIVWARGELVDCLAVAKAYHAKGDKGASVSVRYPDKFYNSDNRPSESVMQFVAICAAAGYTFGDFFAKGDDGQQVKPSWWTAKHDAVSDAMSQQQWFPALVGIACNLPDDVTKEQAEAAFKADIAAHRPSWARQA